MCQMQRRKSQRAWSFTDVARNTIIATQTVPIGGAHIGITIAEQRVSMVPSVKELLVLFLQGDPCRLFAKLLPL